MEEILTEPWLKSLSHITGGGIIENTNRVIPEHLRLDVNWDVWEIPAIFKLIGEMGKVPEPDLRRTFNCGIGLVLIVDPEHINELQQSLKSVGENWYEIGAVIEA